MRLVEIAHRFLEKRLAPGKTCLDATAGNGQDALFLARTITPGGSLYCVDIQEVALSRTKELLGRHSFFERIF